MRNFLVGMILVLNVTPVFAEGMSQAQILALANAVGSHFEKGSRAIQNGDVFTACSEGRAAARVFNQIDPRDVLPKDRGDYNQLRQTVLNNLQLLKKIC